MEGLVESPQAYVDGYFCPMSHGEVIGDEPYTYEILGKIGYGSQSTVWLAKEYI